MLILKLQFFKYFSIVLQVKPKGFRWLEAQYFSHFFSGHRNLIFITSQKDLFHERKIVTSLKFILTNKSLTLFFYIYLFECLTPHIFIYSNKCLTPPFSSH